jgi:hypothetical protein
MHRTALLACLLPAAVAAAGDWPRVRIESRSAAHSVRQALDGASKRLAHPGCQRLFSEFADQHGRPLRARLLELDATETSYLPLVVFADGSEMEQCARHPSVYAFTTQGSRVVFVCQRRFERVWNQNRRRAEALLIHEMLHTLGLGEDPPTSTEITKRVQDRCSN